MTQEKYNICLRKQCKRYYEDLQNGKRIIRLEKRRKKKISLTDFIKVDDPIGPIELFNSCTRTFGYVIEDACRDYAKLMGADVEKKQKFAKTKIDLLFKHNGILYNLETKTDVELDFGKSKIAKRRLGKLNDAANALFDCEFDDTQLITKMLSITQPLASVAVKFVKSPLKETDLMGYLEFFRIFGVEVDTNSYEEMLRAAWYEEVEAYFTKSYLQSPCQKKLIE